ncbi:MAG TPA: STAS domain-containing protein [bacterium]
MEGIQVSVEKIGAQGDISIIRVGGYIDTTTSSELERALDSLLKAGVVHIVIDLGNVDYISSAGWGIFISEIKGIRERGGDLKLARMIPDVYEVFELLEFHYILKAYDMVEEAVRDFDKEMGRTTLMAEEVPAEKNQMIVEKISPSVPEAPASAGLEEQIRQIALNHPSWGASNIARELNTEKYGFLRIGTLSVWKTLRRLNLGSKKQRENQASWE